MEATSVAHTRLTVPITVDEKQALQAWAREECRGPREQLRYIMRQALQERGLLPVKPIANKGESE